MIALVTAIVLLLVVTAVTLFVSKTVIMEQRVSANEVRAKQAFEAADAGMNYAVGYLGMDGGADHDEDGSPDSGIEPTGSKYSLTITELGGDIYQVVSVGLSDDATGRRTIQQQIHITEPFGSPATHPLITHGLTGFSGNVAVTNRETNATIWAGGEVTSWGSGGTFIADGTYDASGIPNVVQSSGKFGSDTKTGVDVIDTASELANASDTEFFNNFFSGNQEFIRSAATYETTSSNLTDPAGIEGINGSMIWADAEGGEFRISNGTYGTSDSPVIIIVDGDLRLGSSPSINGVVFVTGDVIGGGGTFDVVGSVVVQGKLELTGGGTFSVEYDSDVLEEANALNTIATRLPGTWQDW